MQKIIRTLQFQGAPNAPAVFNAVKQAGLVTDEPTPRNVAALLVALTAPAFVDMAQYTLARLNAATEDGDTFVDVMEKMFSIAPHGLKISQIAICTTACWLRISSFSGALLEFTGPDIKPQAIRNEAIYSGGIISALSMKLNVEPHFLVGRRSGCGKLTYSTCGMLVEPLVNTCGMQTRPGLQDPLHQSHKAASWDAAKEGTKCSKK